MLKRALPTWRTRCWRAQRLPVIPRRGISNVRATATATATATETARTAIPVTPPLPTKPTGPTGPLELPAEVHTAGAKADDQTLREIFDNANVWREFSANQHNPNAARSGLFQNTDLTSPAGFRHYTSRTLAKTQALVAKIDAAATEEELVDVVRDLDLLSDLLCRVIDMSDFVRFTHPDRRIVAAATEAYAAMYEYMNVLNTTTGLYAALQRALASPAVVARLNDEERTVASILRTDFEKSGINLPSAARSRFVALSSEIAELGPQFVGEMRPAVQSLQFDSSRLRGMDPLVVRQLTKRGRVTLPTTGMAASHALCTIEDADVRRELFVASNTAHPEQIRTLEALLQRRAELAELVGAQSYAHVALSDKMAQTPEAVNSFLDGLSAANKPAAAKELDDLAALKAQLGMPGPLQAWDREFLAARWLAAQRSRAKGSDTLSSYFSLGTVMQGLSRLFTSLFGLRLVPVAPAPGETWDAGVRRLDVVSDVDGRVAVVYCDLFSRPGKNPNPAHFTVRCSRRLSPTEGADATDGMASTVTPSGARHQLPTIALLCDFQHPPSQPGGAPPLLGFHDVKTLFHEMGHALHSIAARTALHNVAGTRCATDWAELPSVLMEHFATSPAVLCSFARHWETDAPLPAGLLEARLARDAPLDAVETRTQLVLARADQALHSIPAGGSVDSTAIWAAAVSAESLLPYTHGTSWHGFFGHLFGYGATYYSYLFDRAIAAKVWGEVFAAAPMGREGGERYWREVL
ncbi:hypothetical protein EDC01DRAFT_725978, partial [Geopyxis carbonaria]